MQIDIYAISAGKKVLDELTANIHPDQKAVLLDKMSKMVSCDITCAGSPVDRKLHEMYLDLCDEQARESLDATYNVSFYCSVLYARSDESLSSKLLKFAMCLSKL